jgi:aspartyl-tRNA(Asn)/glutamyl-tRNA(Gln) amidotransferase subunit C
MINKEQVARIARLARLELGEQEVEKMQKDMSAILDYFDILKKAPKPKSQEVPPNALVNQTRKDEIREKTASSANNLVQAAPEKKDGYIKVKSIL